MLHAALNGLWPNSKMREMPVVTKPFLVELTKLIGPLFTTMELHKKHIKWLIDLDTRNRNILRLKTLSGLLNTLNLQLEAVKELTDFLQKHLTQLEDTDLTHEKSMSK